MYIKVLIVSTSNVVMPCQNHRQKQIV